MYALVDINGKQYRAEKGARLKVDHLAKEEGDRMEFESVLMISNDGEVKIGTPYVSGARVKAVVEGEGRDRKIVVFKYKRRKGYRKTRGHRQAFTFLRVEDIAGT
jgi:large subunit ribosomal protein L21